jgi:hypothetical protein
VAHSAWVRRSNGLIGAYDDRRLIHPIIQRENRRGTFGNRSPYFIPKLLWVPAKRTRRAVLAMTVLLHDKGEAGCGLRRSCRRHHLEVICARRRVILIRSR